MGGEKNDWWGPLEGRRVLPPLFLIESAEKTLINALPSCRHDADPLGLVGPALIASGFLYKGSDYPHLEKGGWGGLITKGLTEEERLGNPVHRLAETKSGLINSIGLANPGAKAFCHTILPTLLALGKPIVSNLSGFSVKGYGKLAAILEKEGEGRYTAHEINLSCPNVHGGKLDFGLDPSVIREVIQAVRAETDQPLIAKLTPIVADLRPHAEAALDAGATALTVANTWPGIAVDVPQRKMVLGTGVGGLSGPAILPLTLRHCHALYRAFKCPILGSGGITSVDDALAYILCGARWVQIGTWLHIHPQEALAFPEELNKAIEKEGGLDSFLGALEDRE
ncbi:dihydroorotate dehydrogenase [bacterium]|nr:dihydroorotate dehydrogenase [bacterium]